MLISKNNRFPFLVLTLAFVVYFGCWAYINHHTAYQCWILWKLTLLIGCIYLAGVFLFSTNEDFYISTILTNLMVCLALCLIFFIAWSVAGGHLPEIDADDAQFIFLFGPYAAGVGFTQALVEALHNA
ncbi:hypothetical protein CWS43_26175 [Rahnella sp. AA]|uniref:hypothetical protein n=1 Tax=Rahnella sp. AA TaxID=2057180 RepID=UPI000C323938|nr:hypothetical protein [Rahnella sp. AA]PKE27614.1 hypothetical protein CWS43_26175 [Rahnella sp. AA]